MFKCVLTLILLITIFLIEGCSTTNQISKRSQLSDPIKTGTIYVFTKDSIIYEFKNYKITDTTLVGSGTKRKDGISNAYSGQLSLMDIKYIQAREFSFMKTLYAAGVCITFFRYSLSQLNVNEEFKINQHIYTYSPVGGGGGGGGSCPFIYSWDGRQYHLEAEAFGIGFGKALELKTSSVLPSLKEDDGKLKIRITNERPETHYFNSVELVAIESDKSATVILDAQNVPWPVYLPSSPISAYDCSNNNILNKISQKDHIYWETDWKDNNIFTNIEDTIEIKFELPKGPKSGSLIIHSINTHLINAVYSKVFGFLGDDYLAFINAIDNDPEMISLIKQWIEECTLKAYVLKNGRWEKLGIVYPEANETPFSRIVRFDFEDNDEETLQIRLISVKDVWKLDAVQIDWTEVKPLESLPVKLISAIGPNGENSISQIQFADANYLTLLPPQKLELTFLPKAPPKNKKITYALNVQGYLYEWLQEERSNSRALPVNFIFEDSKIDYLKSLLKHKEIFLPLIYSEWKKIQSIK